MEAEENGKTQTKGPEKETQRQRSSVVFPYGDLKIAVEVAKALSEHGGLGTFDQMAAWLKHETVDSGTFRLKLAAARIFGLIEIRDENVTLTDLGNQIIRPDSEVRARAQAFIHVPLYREIYEKYKGRLLPGDSALEADMVELGVVATQKSRARQGFQRSAEQAKLGKDRLVLPTGVSLDSKPHEEAKGRKMETYQAAIPSGDLSPMISVLLKSLPPAGSEWSREAREQWMRIFEMTLDNLYKDKTE